MFLVTDVTYSYFFQFCHQPKSAIREIPERFSSPSPNTLAFLTSDDSQEIHAHGFSEQAAETMHTLPNTFLASSENGFVMSRSGDEAEASWTCTVPGGLGSLQWD